MDENHTEWARLLVGAQSTLAAIIVFPSRHPCSLHSPKCTLCHSLILTVHSYCPDRPPAPSPISLPMPQSCFKSHLRWCFFRQASESLSKLITPSSDSNTQSKHWVIIVHLFSCPPLETEWAHMADSPYNLVPYSQPQQPGRHLEGLVWIMETL